MVVSSKCPYGRCSVKVNPELPTRVVQRKKSTDSPGAWPRQGAAARQGDPEHLQKGDREAGQPPRRRIPLRLVPVQRHGAAVPLPPAEELRTRAKHVPADGRPARDGMGWDGDNLTVQLAADIPATAWLQQSWTGGPRTSSCSPRRTRAGRRGRGRPPGQAAPPVPQRLRRDNGGSTPTTVPTAPSCCGTRSPSVRTCSPALADRRLPVTPSRRRPSPPRRSRSGSPTATRPPAEHQPRARTPRPRSAGRLRRTRQDPDEIADPVTTPSTRTRRRPPDYHAAYGPTYSNSRVLPWPAGPAQAGEVGQLNGRAAALR